MDFCHLHVHTEYSQLDGFGTTKNYANTAKKLGFKYLGITDHGNIDGLIKFQQACVDNDIKPILGCELYVVDTLDKKAERKHMCVFIKDKVGFKNLCEILSFANLEGFYRKPRVTHEFFLEHCKGLVVSTACIATFIFGNGGIEFLENLHDILNDDLYFEYMPHVVTAQKIINKKVLKIQRRFKSKGIATNDCHYIKRNDSKAQEVLLAIQRKSKWKDPKRWRFDIDGLHLRKPREMISYFEKQSVLNNSQIKKSMRTTIEIAEKCCDFQIKSHNIKLPKVKTVNLKSRKDEAKFLKKTCMENFEKEFDVPLSDSPEYKKRFVEEFKLIKNKNFIRYFLIVWELIHWCNQNNIMVGPGRGSVGGSLIAYLLGITQVDPIIHKLLFSRFINEDRIDLPDIDIDFEDIKRPMIRKHLEDMYGRDNVAGVSSFNRMKARSVIRDVSRVFDVPYAEVDRFAKLIEDNDENTGIQDAIDNYNEGKEFYKKHPKVVKIAKKLEGQIRGYGQHAAAIVVSRQKIHKSGRCNLIKRNDITLINWGKEDTEYVGLMKLDILGLKLLSILNETLRLIKENHGVDIVLKDLDLEDKKVLKEINAGNTVGVFQLNTWAMTNLIKEMNVTKFRHISDASALVRPGPFNSGMTEEYIKRRAGGDYKKRHPVYEEITKDTYGLLVYQEQVMEVINKVAGLPYSTADKIRKVIGKKRNKKAFEQYEQMFLDGCKKTKIFSVTEAKEFWKGLQEWARYGFNLSHSTEYALLGYWCACLKYYYPTEFICASLTYGAQQKKSEIVEEAYRLGLTLVLPKVGISAASSWVARENKLYVPFIEVKGIGEVKAVEASMSSNTNKGLNTFFKKKQILKPKKIQGKFGELLDEIGAYDLEEIQPNPEVAKYFGFRIASNPSETYQNLFKKIGKVRLDRVESIINGDLKEIRKHISNLDQSLIKERSYKYNRKALDKLRSCKLCALRNECKAPVLCSSGKYNIAIIGEAPGYEEDWESQGFVGRSGKKIWQTLKPKYRREDFHITNINKCFPSQSRKPNSDQIQLCARRHLHVELRKLKPIVILAFGNTCLEFFTGRKSGISNMSGKIIWNEYYGTWIVFCMHPAATLHNPDNEPYFKSGIKSFKRLIRTLKV